MTTTVGTAAPFVAGAPGDLMARRRQRSRRRGMALAVLLMLLGAAGGLWAVSWSDEHVDAVVLTRPVQRGHMIAVSDLAVSRVSVEGTRARLASPQAARTAIVGRQALVDLAAGTLVTPEMVGSALPPVGAASVGVRLAPEELPSAQLRAGDWVQVVSTDRAGGQPRLIGAAVQVVEVRSLSAGPNVGDTVVYLNAPADSAAYIASAAAASGGVRLLGVRS
jgi:SAF domain